MKDKFPEIYKKKIENVKSKVQKNFYYHASTKDSEIENKNAKDLRKDKTIDKNTLINKINDIFKRPNYVYQTDVNIMYKNGKNYPHKIIGIKDNYLITFEGEHIYFDDIIDIK